MVCCVLNGGCAEAGAGVNIAPPVGTVDAVGAGRVRELSTSSVVATGARHAHVVRQRAWWPPNPPLHCVMGLTEAQEVGEAIDAESTELEIVGAAFTRFDAGLEGQVVTVTHLDWKIVVQNAGGIRLALDILIRGRLIHAYVLSVVGCIYSAILECHFCIRFWLLDLLAAVWQPLLAADRR